MGFVQTWIDGLLGRWGWVKAGNRGAPPWALHTAEMSRWSVPDGALFEHQADLYRTLSWINIAVTQTANEVAVADFRVQRLVNDEKVEIRNHPFERLLLHPNPHDSRFDLFFQTTAFRELTGNAYWWLNKEVPEAEPDELWVIPSHKLKPIPDGKMYISGYEYDPGYGQKMVLSPWQIVHFRRFHPRNAFVGLSPIEALAIIAEGDRAAQKYSTNYYAVDHAKPSGILAFRDLMSKTQFQRTQQRIEQEYGGTKRKLMLLDGVGANVNWISTSLSQKDMEFLLTRKFTREEIFAVLSPGLANVLDVNATEANASTGLRMFKNHVYAQMVALAQTVTNEILPVYGRDLVAQFDDVRITDKALQLQEIAQYMRTHSIDEVRKFYYGDQGIGDERGRMLVQELVAQRQMQGGRGGSTETIQEPHLPGEEQNEPIRSLREEELRRWRRYAAKRKPAKASQFVPEHLPEDVARVICERLKAAMSEEEVSAAFAGPF